MVAIMGSPPGVEQYVRNKVKAERLRREWSQADVAKKLSDNGIQTYPTTIAKIEAGVRAIKIDEAVALANLFDITLDTLTGRRFAGSGQLGEMIALAERAQKLLPQIASVRDELQDLRERLDSEIDLGLFESCITGESNFSEVPLEDWRALFTSYATDEAKGMLASAIGRLTEAASARDMGLRGLADHLLDLTLAMRPIGGESQNEVYRQLKILAIEWKASSSHEPKT
ncbi:XRE family transcriptional regulator [Mycobacteroides abscessus]|nr:XRE family transcriptional regulator [Mycobacteroides abscessus]RIR93465.1 XRE family transcriptional regulator [Mycobacteroides abscessus]